MSGCSKDQWCFSLLKMSTTDLDSSQKTEDFIHHGINTTTSADHVPLLSGFLPVLGSPQLFFFRISKPGK